MTHELKDRRARMAIGLLAILVAAPWVIIAYKALWTGKAITFTDDRWAGAEWPARKFPLPDTRNPGVSPAPVDSAGPPPTAQEIDDLFEAVCRAGERSHGDANAYNEAEDAAGIAQIRPIYVRDVNRILKLQGSDKRYTLEDRYSPVKSREMFEIYCRHYYNPAATGPQTWQESWVRMHNGGPRGFNKESTLEYWVRVDVYLACKYTKIGPSVRVEFID